MMTEVHQAVTVNMVRIRAEGTDRWAGLLKTTMPEGLVRDAILASLARPWRGRTAWLPWAAWKPPGSTSPGSSPTPNGPGSAWTRPRPPPSPRPGRPGGDCRGHVRRRCRTGSRPGPSPPQAAADPKPKKDDVVSQGMDVGCRVVTGSSPLGTAARIIGTAVAGRNACDAVRLPYSGRYGGERSLQHGQASSRQVAPPGRRPSPRLADAAGQCRRVPKGPSPRCRARHRRSPRC